MHVEHRCRIDDDAESRPNDGREPRLLRTLDGAEPCSKAGVLGQRPETREIREIADPRRPDPFADQGRQGRIGLVQPAARRDAVGDVDDPVREEPVEVREDGALHQRGVNLGHAVDVMTADGREMGHAQPAVAPLVHDRHTPWQIRIIGMLASHVVQKPLVDFVDDLEVARQDLREELDGPRLECFGHQRVVGVREGAARDVPGAGPLQPMHVDEQPHQFGDADRRMRVVQLDGDLVRQRIQVRVMDREAAQDVLERRADEEILLLEPKLAAHLGGVVRVQHFGEVL